MPNPLSAVWRASTLQRVQFSEMVRHFDTMNLADQGCDGFDWDLGCLRFCYLQVRGVRSGMALTGLGASVSIYKGGGGGMALAGISGVLTPLTEEAVELFFWLFAGLGFETGKDRLTGLDSGGSLRQRKRPFEHDRVPKSFQHIGEKKRA